MPIYEYYCKACGHEFELIQKITDRPIRKCEECGKLQARRKISQTSFVLKGSGWYVTDYGGKKPSESAKNGNGTSNGNGSSNESKSSDSKSSEKKTETKSTSGDAKAASA